ncbi:hypothetical protein BBP40_005569 [Aspergillus hancockii]|nr:hypothetical protein BBP40_005569 [Aspergillus hancockii]
MLRETDVLRRLTAEERRQQEENLESLAAEQRLLRECLKKTSKTTLPTFLDGLHGHLFLGLDVQYDKTQSTHGDRVNATNKLRPRKLKAWDTFAKEEEEIWQSPMDSSLVKD